MLCVYSCNGHIAVLVGTINLRMLAVLIDRGGNSGLRFLSACAERNLRSEFPWERKFAVVRCFGSNAPSTPL